jgi:hypothetical protein
MSVSLASPMTTDLRAHARHERLGSVRARLQQRTVASRGQRGRFAEAEKVELLNEAVQILCGDAN